MTKAEKIFKDTYYECRNHIRSFGVDRNSDRSVVGFNSFFTDLPVSIRTCNDVQKFIFSELKRLRMNDSLGIGSSESQALSYSALEMVQATLDNQVKSIRRFQMFLKS